MPWAASTSLFRQVDRTFEMVAKAVSPTVVHIVAQKTIRVEEGRRSRQFEETGSGVIVRSERLPGLYILTNHHVVENTKPAKIRIFLRDGRSLLPARIWSDEKADIAVLKLDRDDLPAARMGNSDEAPVGSWVMALGSPFGLMHSVSQGIISARGRHMDELQDVENQDFLQTDAAINPGNSGGPLVNMRGEVIGINNSIASNGGGNEGVGFSIPINLARWIMNELIAQWPGQPGCPGRRAGDRVPFRGCGRAGHGTAARALGSAGSTRRHRLPRRACARGTSSSGSAGSRSPTSIT